MVAAQVGQGHVPTTANVHWHSDLSEAENVSLVIRSLLGPDFELREPKIVLPEEPGHKLALFDVITSVSLMPWIYIITYSFDFLLQPVLDAPSHGCTL